ncbi:hypothetical protein CYLTODRAFT_489729 [Cylindrobasidium torrendii FP15055 ss-10]|uniref:Transmembrane protein n=1 Tax=Cylindrobasidium torrendii FP15055 ss-10 TaxID=1314674 RepID=A0A0D7BFX2_9AGAR|nr:hypothetical protein CYLTODRAFT_489729 [Cylindrobasidium torrendii FP15055 ss-10]
MDFLAVEPRGVEFPVGGTQLAASWANLILFSLQCHLSYACLTGPRKDRFFAYCIWAALVSDLVGTILVFGSTWTYYLHYVRFGIPLVSSTGTQSALVIFTAVSASIEHAFFLARYYGVTKDRIGSAIVLFLTIAHAVIALANGILVFIFPSKSGPPILSVTVTAGSLGAFIDLLLAFLMTWRVTGMNTTFKSTQSILRRVWIFSMSSGFTTSIVTVLSFVFIFVERSVWLFIFSCQGRVYSLTILLNLVLLKASNQVDNNQAISTNFRITESFSGDPSARSGDIELGIRFNIVESRAPDAQDDSEHPDLGAKTSPL